MQSHLDAMLHTSNVGEPYRHGLAALTKLKRMKIYSMGYLVRYNLHQ